MLHYSSAKVQYSPEKKREREKKYENALVGVGRR